MKVEVFGRYYFTNHSAYPFREKVYQIGVFILKFCAIPLLDGDTTCQTTVESGDSLGGEALNP